MRGNIDIQIRDLDQTVVGNPAYDLIRLAVSLATAARSADLPGVTTTLMVEAMIEAYSYPPVRFPGSKPLRVGNIPSVLSKDFCI
jgi:uncharacterized protein (DUF2252 family)